MTVLYCVAAVDPQAALPPGGLPGAAPPRALPLFAGLSAIVATVSEPDYAPDVVNDKLRDMDWVAAAALGHEQLLEAVMRASSAVLPMKLLTLFSGDERLLADLEKGRKTLERAARRVAGCEEYGLRIIALDTPAQAVPGASDRPASGTAFLERKKQARDEVREQGARRAAFAREAYDAMAADARAAVLRPVQPDETDRPLIDAAFLVGREERAAFGRVADALSARAEAASCLFKLTGPWPPYHFVRMDDAS